MWKIFGFVSLCGLISPLLAIRCLVPHGPCKCQTDQGFIDLSPLDSTNGRPRFKLEHHGHDENAVYSYNPCTTFSDSSCRHAFACKTLTDSGDDEQHHRIRWKHGSGTSRVEQRIALQALFFPRDMIKKTTQSYSIGGPGGYQWASSDINQDTELPPDSREHNDDEPEHLFLNMRGNSQHADVARTSSVKLVCSDHHEAMFTLSDVDKTSTKEHYSFTLKTSHACPKHGDFPTETPKPEPQPEPQPTRPDYGDYPCLDDSEIVFSKRTLVIAAISLFLILILVILSTMYCTLICCVAKKAPYPKQKEVQLFTIQTSDTGKKEMLE